MEDKVSLYLKICYCTSNLTQIIFKGKYKNALTLWGAYAKTLTVNYF